MFASLSSSGPDPLRKNDKMLAILRVQSDYRISCTSAASVSRSKHHSHSIRGFSFSCPSRVTPPPPTRASRDLEVNRSPADSCPADLSNPSSPTIPAPSSEVSPPPPSSEVLRPFQLRPAPLLRSPEGFWELELGDLTGLTSAPGLVRALEGRGTFPDAAAAAASLRSRSSCCKNASCNWHWSRRSQRAVRTGLRLRKEKQE